ncbi:DUF397 domain-containing protein [Streptomyces hebeiensis]
MSEPRRVPDGNWRSSTYSQSNGGECVEVADGIAGVVPVRDSKTPERSHLTFRPSVFASFVQAVRRGDFTA